MKSRFYPIETGLSDSIGYIPGVNQAPNGGKTLKSTLFEAKKEGLELQDKISILHA